jgi:anti-sigma-K factor RskA
VDEPAPTTERGALAALVRQHEQRLTRLEVKHEEMEKAVERRFESITTALHDLKSDIKAVQLDVRALVWRTAGSAAGGGGLIAVILWLAERSS